MNPLEIRVYRKLPPKLCCVGMNHERTKTFELAALAAVIEFALSKLAKNTMNSTLISK